MVLERAGYHVTVTLDANAALSLLAANGCQASYSLVITDHIMPALDGAEFVASLREICQDLPVLVLSGMAEAEEKYEGLGVDFRVKPCAPEELLATVARLVDEPPLVKTA
jgi:DNA-binding response OmpR family regulator